MQTQRTSPHSVHRRARLAATVIGMNLCPALVLAQTAAGTPTPVVGGRSLMFEYIIVVLAVCAALIAVCRSSRRN